MASFLTDLKRKLGVQQPRQAWDERIGASPDDMLRVAQSSADVNGGQAQSPALQTPYSQNINPTVRPQQPAPSPRFLDNVRAAVNQPQPTPQPTLDQALMSGGPTQTEQPAQQQLQAQPQGMQRNPYRDQLTQDEAQLRALEDKKDKFWKRAVIAGINAGQAGFGYQPTQIQTSRTRDIAKTQGRIARDMKILQDTGQIDQREANILAGQQRIQQGDERIRQGDDRLKAQSQRAEDADLLRYYNGRTDFDPDDPAEAQFVARWQKRFGYKPNKNVRGSQLATVNGYDADGNPMVSIVNKGSGTVTAAAGALPTTTDKQLGRQQQATIAATNESGRNTRAANAQAGANQRSAASIAARGPKGAAASKPNPNHQKIAADRWGAINRRNKLIEDTNTEINRVNAMSDDDAKKAYPTDESGKPWNTSETVKNQRLRELGETRRGAATSNQSDVDKTQPLNSGFDFKADDQGRVTMTPRAGATSDLNQPIQGTPTQDPKVQKYADKYFNGNYQKALSEIKRQRGQ